MTVFAAGCAKQEFRRQEFSASASAVGFRTLPAKIDILIVPDNTPSINTAFSVVQAQLASMVATMQNKEWDYHFARSMLANPTPINRVLVNPKYNSRTLSDGTDIGPAGLVPADRAETNPANFPILDGVVATGSNDNTYNNTINTLLNAKADTYTNFLRDDSLLAVIVLTNGYESTIDPNHNGQLNLTTLQARANSFLSLKNNDSRLIRFYPVAANTYHSGTTTGDSCLVAGGTSFFGGSYTQMNSFIPGLGRNFCDGNQLATVLSDIEANLSITRQSYVYSNIVLTDNPVPSSIKVFKNGVELANSPTNGWTFQGFGTVATVTHTGNANASTCDGNTLTPLIPALNRRTGYIIQLNGCARMLGNDVPDVKFEKQ